MGNFQEIHIEKDFWDDFIVEAFEHLEEIENNAMSLEKNPEDMDIIHTMFRAFHTIKGLSGFVEHSIIQEVAHKTETLMDYCRKGELQVNTKIVDAILKSSDYIKKLCDDVDAYKDENLIAQIEKLLVVLEELAKIDKLFEEKKEEAPLPTEQEEVVEKNVNPEEALEAFAMEITEVENNTEPEEVVATKEKPEEKIKKTEPEPVSTPIEAVKPEPVKELEKSKKEDTSVQKESVEAKESKEEISSNAETRANTELKSFQTDIMEKLKGAKEENTSSVAVAVKESVAAKQSSANEEYMKVANHKIDHLVDMMGELIINQALIEQYVSSNYNDDRQLVTNMSGFLRITRELQNLSMSLRMVALKPTFQKLTRIARDTIQELHKDVEFITSGENTEIDRAVAEKLLDPLVHMIKNAISHGVESDPTDRVKLEKPRKATVELNAYSKRGKIFIEVKDDGKGINTEIVYKKALEKGIIDPSRTYSEDEIKEFIMLPGFSTAAVVDNISGRGVGMDVVKTQIFKLGGKVNIQSTLNEGSTFTLEVPVNHAIMNGTIIDINNQHFVVPTVNVKEFLQPTENQWIFTKSKRTMIKVRDNIIPIVPISTFFKGIVEPKHVPLVMVLELDQELRAVPIVNVISRQEVVVKPVGTEFSHLKYISGMSILGTGKVSLILDIDYLFRKEVSE